MNIKKTIKKVSALATGAAMLGATVMGAVAYDLGDYPEPFVKDGAFSGKLVVGTGGTAEGIASDYLGMVDIATSLQAASRTAVTVSGGVVTVEGGEDFDDLYLADAALAYDTRLDSNDLEGFVDADFDFDDDDYDYEDYISLATGAIEFRGSQYDDEFGKDIYGVIENPNAEIKYVVEIDADFNWSNVGETGSDDDVEFKFLGKTLKVTSFSQTSMTVEASAEQYLEEGDEVVIDGHTVSLDKVGDNAVRVTVDGITKSISTSGTQPWDATYDDADDFEVVVESTFYIEGASDNSATLTLGTDVSDSVAHGDSAELFGEPSKAEKADWIWNINMTALDTLNYVGLDLNIDRERIDAEDDEERNALAEGEAIDLPNGYGSIEFATLKESEFTELTVTVDKDFKLKEDTGGDTVEDGWGFMLDVESDDSEDFIVGTTKTEKVWVIYDDAETYDIWYYDGNDEINHSTATSISFKLDDQSFVITPTVNATLDAGYILNVTFPETGEELFLNATKGNDYFGDEDDDDVADLTFGTIDGQTDYDGEYVMTDYGAYFETPKAQFGSGNSFVMSVPNERQYATVLVKSSKTTSTTSSEGGSYQIVDIGLGLAVKDSDAEQLLGSENLIVVGGPYVNSIAAELMGNPTGDQVAEMFEPGKAKIKLFEDKNAVLVAGYSAQDTVGAARVLADYNNPEYDLTGDEVEVMVPSLSQLSVGAPTLPSMVDEIQADEPEMDDGEGEDVDPNLEGS